MATKTIEPKRRQIKSPIKKYNESLAEDQAMAKKVIKNHILTTLRGAAGTGKTFLAVCYALERFNMEVKRGGIDGIVMTRAMVSPKDKQMGFLPGDLWEKIDPWLVPIKEIIVSIEGNEAYEKMVKEKTLDIAPLAVIKGRTFTNKVVIVDEAADLTKKDIEAIFTRIGKGSQILFMGDMRQCVFKDANGDMWEEYNVFHHKFIDWYNSQSNTDPN